MIWAIFSAVASSGFSLAEEASSEMLAELTEREVAREVVRERDAMVVACSLGAGGQEKQELV